MNGSHVGEFIFLGTAMMLLWIARAARHSNVVMYLALMTLMEGHLWLHQQQALIPARMFQVFIASLLGLVAFHRYHKHSKLIVIALGSLIMTILFVIEHDWAGFVEHFLGQEKHAEERRHILVNLGLLLPGFAIISYYFEHSAACGWIERRVKSDVGILWMVFGLSIILDNIASAMIGGSLIMTRYHSVIQHCRRHKDPKRRKLPRWLFMLLIGVVATSNLGGAPSFIGDTTTVMIYLSGAGIWLLAKGFVGALIGQYVFGRLIIVRHKELPEDYDHTLAGRQTYIDWTWSQFVRGVLSAIALVLLPWRWGELAKFVLAGRGLYPLIGIAGLVAGNVWFDQPGLGLWCGLLLGITAAKVIDMIAGTAGTKFSWIELAHAVPNTAFLLLLVFAAKLLPLDQLLPLLEKLSKDQIAIAFGLLSPVFDNIPLTSLALDIGGFDWALLALSVGFGGSMLWFGSSAGVALAKQFPELENTPDWFPRPFLILFLIFVITIVVHMLTWRWIPEMLAGG